MKKVVTMMISSFLFFSTLFIFSNTGSCEEITINTLYVGGSGEGNFSGIQDAINASTDGDTIIVYTGIYNENIEINKSISLIGENKDTTIINGENKLDVVTIYASWVNITGFTIQEGLVSGIWIESFGDCNIYQNNINANGIGIFIIISSNSKIYNNTISGNSVTGLNVTCSFAILFPFNNTFSSVNNTIFHNNFLNNTQHTNDECNSFWSYNHEGNYYDNYLGLDKNNDGIGDEPYEIPGGDNEDKYPLMMPYDGTIRLKEFYVDEGSLHTMLIIGMIVAILFCLPIGYIWYRKYYKVK
jgi:parallel beta-helix repeat protein